MGKTSDVSAVINPMEGMSSAKVVACTQIAWNKEYTYPFVMDVFRSLEGVDHYHIMVDKDVEEWTTEVAKLFEKGTYTIGHIPLPSEPVHVQHSRISPLREVQRQFAVDGGYDYLYFHDSDMIAAPNTIDTLMEVDAGIVSGLYSIRGWVIPLLCMTDDGGTGNCMDITNGETIPINSGENLRGVPVRAYGADEHGYTGHTHDLAFPTGVGMGAALIRRDVLEAIPFRDGDFWHRLNIMPGEDYWYCWDWIERSGERPVVLLDHPVWHVAENGTAAMPATIEGISERIRWNGGGMISNAYGEWHTGAWRSVEPGQMTELKVGFQRLSGKKVVMAVKKLEELWTPSAK